MEKMSWLSRLNLRPLAGPRGSRGNSPQGPGMADPETCFMVFKNHWAQVLRILEKRGPWAAADNLSAVRNNTYQMVTLLAEERPRAEGSPGPLLEFVLAENVLEHLLSWHLAQGVTEECKGELVKLYETLVSQARQPLLRHEPIRTPLLRLLSLCAGPASPALESGLVLLLHQLCVSTARDPPLLELFFYAPAEQGPPDLLLFSLLIPFIHHEGAVGQQARDALLLLMAVSAGSCSVAQYITKDSYFCPVLATGLSARYSSLPRKLEVRGDDWHFLRREDWMGVPALVLFMNSLEFCNAVIQVAHPVVQKQLVGYIHSGFLVPVVGPALHKTSVEEMIASTAYLDLFLRSVSETALLKTFLHFLLLHQHDGSTILDTLVARIASNSRLCMVSLSLFRTLIGLHCEDVLLQLVLRYLIPCGHIMQSQKRALKEPDLYGKAAARFLSLIPCCCPEGLPLPVQGQEERAAWSKGPGSPGVDSSSVVTIPKPSTPSRISFFTRQSSSSTEAQSPPPRSPGTPAGSPGTWEEVSELEGNYLEYLRDARVNIDRCVWACRAWSAPYDGEEPSAGRPAGDGSSSTSAHPSGPTSPRTKKRGLPEEGAGPEMAPAPPDPKDVGPLLNGSWADSGLKKGRWCPQKSLLENGAANPSAPCPDSLVDELLTLQAPLENGGTLTVEKFHMELSQLEDEMANRGSAKEAPLPTSPSEPDPLSREEEEAYRSFASHPDGPVGSARSADLLAQIIGSPLRTVGQPLSQPSTGPFLGILLAKLENMLHNSLYVNFLLTGLIAQLASYPQPLLRSFLLNTNMVFQPSVKSLLQVLGLVKTKIESFAASQQDFPSLLFKAKKYLIARAKLDSSDPQGTGPSLRRPEALVKSRKPTIGELILRHTNSPTRARQAAQLALQHMREGPMAQALSGSALFRGSAEKQGEALRVKNAVYCAVIFSEFLKELAAIAQAHAVTSPFLLDPPLE